MLYYTLRNGNVVSEYELHKAFEICTGETYDGHNATYLKWLYGLLGNSIVEAKKETELDIEYFVRHNNIIAAVRMYREIHGGTLREAKEAVDKIREGR